MNFKRNGCNTPKKKIEEEEDISELDGAHLSTPGSESRMQRMEGFTIIQPIPKRREKIIRAQQKAELMDKMKAEEKLSKSPQYETPNHGAVLGSAFESDELSGEIDVSKKRATHFLRKKFEKKKNRESVMQLEKLLKDKENADKKAQARKKSEMLELKQKTLQQNVNCKVRERWENATPGQKVVQPPADSPFLELDAQSIQNQVHWLFDAAQLEMDVNDFPSMIDTLEVIGENALSDKRKRVIRLSNEHFRKKVGQWAKGISLMKGMGFILCGNEHARGPKDLISSGMFVLQECHVQKLIFALKALKDKKENWDWSPTNSTSSNTIPEIDAKNDFFLWLKSENLHEYFPIMSATGFDDVGLIALMNQQELDSMCDICSIKPGHRIKIKNIFGTPCTV